jgi:membrane associated rhomboid family serine protease
MLPLFLAFSVWLILLTLAPRRALYVPFTSIVIPYDASLGLLAFLLLEFSTMYRTRANRLFDHAVHLGGFAAGILYGFALRPKGPKEPTEEPHEEPTIELPPIEKISSES